MPVLKDVLAHDLAVVFCGTAPSAASAAAGAYYAKPGNRFWQTLHDVGLTPMKLEPGACWRITRYGVGLTDLAKSVAGNDSALAPADFDPEGLRRKVLQYQPRVLAFTSKRAGGEYLGRSASYGLQGEQIGKTRVFVLNSTSGLATAHWNGGHQWHELAKFLRTDGQA